MGMASVWTLFIVRGFWYAKIQIISFESVWRQVVLFFKEEEQDEINLALLIDINRNQLAHMHFQHIFEVLKWFQDGSLFTAQQQRVVKTIRTYQYDCRPHL